MKDMIIRTSRLLYQNRIKEGYEEINKIITMLLPKMNSMDKEQVEKINKLLESELKAMENQDAVLMADILRYDLLIELGYTGE